MTTHDQDVFAVCIDLLEKSPKGTVIMMYLSIGTFKVIK